MDSIREMKVSQSMERPSQTDGTLVRQQVISVPAQDQEKWIALREFDWKRIYNKVCKIERPFNYISVWYSILFGVSVSFGVSIIPLKYSQGLPPWVIPLYACICGFSFVMALTFVIINKKLSSHEGSNITAVKEDMERTEKYFQGIFRENVD